MIIKILGAGAGGGLPQWNCGCQNCNDARDGKIGSMSQSSVAVSANGSDWVVLNASPDIRTQLQQSARLFPTGLRGSPVKAVVITNGDIDHIAGLLTLREKTAFTLYGTAETLDVIKDNSVFSVLDSVCVNREAIVLGYSFAPVEGLDITAFAVPGKVPLFLETENLDLAKVGEQTIGLKVFDGEKTAYYIPGCAAIPDDLLAVLSDADLLLFDGTVWKNDEMLTTKTGRKTGARMGHISMNGDGGSLERLSGLDWCKKYFVHINNTNPILQPESHERHVVEEAGWTVCFDGMEISL